MKLKARSSVVRRAVALGLGVVIALTGTTAMNPEPAHAADEPTLMSLVLGFAKEHGLDSTNVVMEGLAMLGVGKGGGPSLEEIGALLDEKLGALEGRIRQIAGELRAYANLLDYADVLTCTDMGLTYGKQLTTMTLDTLQWFAIEMAKCVWGVDNRIALLKNNADAISQGYINNLAAQAGWIWTEAERANLQAGFVVMLPDPPCQPDDPCDDGTGLVRSGLSGASAEFDAGVIGDLRTALVSTLTNARTALAPDCGTRELHREGQFIEVERFCEAFNGTRATFNEVIVENQQRPPFDYTELRRKALVGTAAELADGLLPEVRKPLAAVGCDAIANTLSCGAVNADPLGTAVSTTRYWVNGVAVPAWNDDLSNLSTSCVPGSQYTVRMEITNALGYRDDFQTQTLRCAGNRALSRPATADSSCASTESAAKAVNGLASGLGNKWCSVGAVKWWQVNLQGTYPIKSIVVRHAGAGGEPSGWNTRDFRIRVSTNGTSWTTLATVVGNTADVTTNYPIIATSAAYVRLEITRPTSTSDSAARLYEVEVYI